MKTPRELPTEHIVLDLTAREAVALRRAAGGALRCEFNDRGEWLAYRRAINKLWSLSGHWSRFHFEWTNEAEDDFHIKHGFRGGSDDHQVTEPEDEGVPFYELLLRSPED